jgi:hypothetical protein
MPLPTIAILIATHYVGEGRSVASDRFSADAARQSHPNSVPRWEMKSWHRSPWRATVSGVDVKARGTSAPGLRLVLLASLSVMVPMADMPIASAAPDGAEPDVASKEIGTTTLSSLLDFDPVRPRWAGRRAKRGGGAAASRAFPPRRPLSAAPPAKAHEIDPGPAP